MGKKPEACVGRSTTVRLGDSMRKMDVFFHHCCSLFLNYTNGTYPRGTRDNALRTVTTSIQPYQIRESNGASAFCCHCCYLTLSWTHYCFCGISFVGSHSYYSLLWLCWIVCWQVSTIYPFGTLTDTLVSEKCACWLFSPLILSPLVPYHQI